MHSSGHHTLKYDPSTFLLESAYFQNHRYKTVNPSGVESQFIQPQASLRKINHPGDRRLTSPATLMAGSLVLTDSLSSSENPECSSQLGETSFRTWVLKISSVLLDEQMCHWMRGVKDHRIYRNVLLRIYRNLLISGQTSKLE